MKKSLLGTILLALAIAVPVPTMARVDVSIGIGIPLPPPIVFAAPPAVIVLPDTYYVYAVPDIAADIFFWNGWWWRPWEGRWYRSYYYDRGWVYYNSVPSFYFNVDPGWRGYYRTRNWYGHRWNYERIPHQRLHKNWKSWHSNRYWERKGTWGVQSYRPRPQKQRQELRHQRQKQYQQRPDVQRHQQQIQKQYQQRPDVRRHQQQIQKQQRQRQIQKPQVPQQRLKQKPQPQQRHSQPRGQQRQGKSPHQKSQGRPDIR